MDSQYRTLFMDVFGSVLLARTFLLVLSSGAMACEELVPYAKDAISASVYPPYKHRELLARAQREQAQKKAILASKYELQRTHFCRVQGFLCALSELHQLHGGANGRKTERALPRRAATTEASAGVHGAN